MLACELLIVISQTGWCIFKTVKTLSQFAPHLVLPCRPFITLRQCVQHKQTPPPNTQTHAQTHAQTGSHAQTDSHTHTHTARALLRVGLLVLQHSAALLVCDFM